VLSAAVARHAAAAARRASAEWEFELLDQLLARWRRALARAEAEKGTRVRRRAARMLCARRRCAAALGGWRRGAAARARQRCGVPLHPFRRPF
jgi:hypothetical protein